MAQVDLAQSKARIGMSLDTLHRYGGLTRSAWELAQHLSKDYEVVFITTEAELNGEEKFSIMLIKKGIVPHLKRVTRALRVSLLKRKLNLDLLMSHGANGIFQDVVVTHSVHKKWFLWSLKRTPFLSKAWLLKILNPVHYATIFLETLQYSKPFHRLIIAISHQVKLDLINYFGIDEKRIVVIHHGVNVEEFDLSEQTSIRRSVRADLNIDEGTKVIIFAAHEFKRKGLSILLRSLANARNSNFVLLIAGQDDPTDFKNEAQRLNIENKVRFLGVRKDIKRLYLASDVFAFPTSYEAFGLVITEAMACALPVIVPRDAGASELIEDGVDGFLMSSWDSTDELSQHLDRLDDVDLRTKIGKAARNKVLSWTWDHASQEYSKQLSKLLKNKKD